MVLDIRRRPLGRRRMVADELEQRAVGVAEVHALPAAARTLALDRPELHLHPTLAQMGRGILDRPVPAEAQVAVPGPHRIDRARLRLAPGPVDVQLLLADAVGVPAVLELDQLRAED